MIKGLALSAFKEVADLQDWAKKKNFGSVNADARCQIKIAVIDDQPFAPLKNLKNAGYNVTEIDDLKSIAEVEDFQIVLCDLHGVGAHFQSRYQGGFLIDEIKRTYPHKFVVAYTGGSTDPDVVEYAREISDAFLKKDVDINEWRDTLDGLVQSLRDPLEIWRRQRDSLVERDVPTKEILRMEDAFVRSILAARPDIYVHFVNVTALNPDIRAIGQGLISSAIFKLLFG